MILVIEIDSGPLVSRRLVVRPGESARIGRERGDLVVAHDAGMSGVHFALVGTPEGGRVRDLNSTTGTFLNAAPVLDAVLRHGDQIRAGSTSFTVAMAADERALGLPRPACPAPEPPALGALRSLAEPLFAVLDAARDGRILDLLRTIESEHASLYEGLAAERLVDVAPYLVRLPPGSALLEALVREGWGHCWGIYLTSRRPFGAVREFLRQFLVVELEGEGKVLFRFYDPRVLREFLPVCTARQQSLLFADVAAYLVEGGSARSLQVFRDGGSGLLGQVIPLATGPAVDASGGTPAR
ncbi:MAG: DUF4123 domain-containing protein [Deltaproteobacteria bacterium]|nr:DUF4123 domain-containing protein [Deltaproteobacteria bacterium]